MAKDLIGHEPFAVILPDDVVVGDRPCIGQLIHAYQQTHGSVVAVMEVPAEDTRRYGVIAAEPSEDPLDHGRLHRVTRLVEKPAPEDAPSNLAIIGRYVLTPKIFDKLEQTPRGSGGEIQLTDAIAALMEEQQVFAYEFEGTRYDAGHHHGLAQGVGRARPPAAGARREFRAYLGAWSSDRRRRTACGTMPPTRRERPAPHRGDRRGGDRNGPWRPLSAGRAARSGRHGDHLSRDATRSSDATWPSSSCDPSTCATLTSPRASGRRRRARRR